MRVGSADAVLRSGGLDELPADGGWLTPGEEAVLARLRVPKRAADWSLGRWVAKGAVVGALAAEVGGEGLRPRDVEILAGPGGAPGVCVLAPGAWPEVALSLSHAAGTGFAAAALGMVRVGCDVEGVAVRSGAFVEDYLTRDEAAWVRSSGADAALRATLVWSAKEAALKALGEGLRRDTRTAVVDVASLAAEDGGDAWRPLRVALVGEGSEAVGVWRGGGGRVWTVVSLEGSRARPPRGRGPADAGGQ